MKKIVPFKKDIMFKTNIAEITSISLEHTLKPTDNNLITGEFIVSGDYKITDTSQNTDDFTFHIPFDINMDDHYIIKNIAVDIDDFYYEIVNENVLKVNIEVCINNLEEKPLMEEKVIVEEIEPPKEKIQNISNELVDKIEEIDERKSIDLNQNIEIANISQENKNIEITNIKQETTEEIKSLFETFDESGESFTTYKVYIVREGDTVDQITSKYNTTKEYLEEYNEINEIKIGDKIIIPALIDAKN